MSIASGVLLAQTMDQQAGSDASQVLQSFGTSDALSSNGMEPLSSDKPMTTVDGSQQFAATTACKASQQFMRVTILPNATSDIQSVSVDLDPNFTGSYTNSTMLAGPYAAVCLNGMVQCDAGTFNNCHYMNWQPDATQGNVTLKEVGPNQLGACYCFNNSCGNNLLWVNSSKVLSDISSGIGVALQQIYPRLSLGRSEQPDAVTDVYYGQNATCGSDSSPEQYYSHAQDLAAAGSTAVQQTGSVANFMSTIPAASTNTASSISCSVTRSVALSEVTRDQVLSLLNITRGAWDINLPGCNSANCIAFSVGDNGYHTYNDGDSCAFHPQSALLQVAHPERLVSATFTNGQWDDYGQVWVGPNLIFTSAPGWTTDGPFPAGQCETGADHYYHPNTDITSDVTGGGDTVKVTVNTATQGGGDGIGYFKVVVNPGCQAGADTLTDGCAAEANNASCAVWEEWVDGVQTVRDGLTTGLGPLPSAHTLQGVTCSVSTGPRNWWDTMREYQCTTNTSPYDFSGVVQRQQTIASSLDTSTGTYTDRVTNPDGTISNPNGTVSLPPPASVSCQQTCETRSARPGSAVGLNGPQSTLNNTGVAWSFNYKACGTDSTCPLDPGEEVVSACDCRSNFAEAATMMQTIRMVKEDQACTP